MASRGRPHDDEPAREFASIRTNDDQLVIYATRNGNAWVQSDMFVTLGSE